MVVEDCREWPTTGGQINDAVKSVPIALERDDGGGSRPEGRY
jgi:hypothetical protein